MNDVKRGREGETHEFFPKTWFTTDISIENPKKLAPLQCGIDNPVTSFASPTKFKANVLLNGVGIGGGSSCVSS